MNWTGFIIAGAVVALGAGAIFVLNEVKKRNMEKLFNQVNDMARQVPKQKKHPFLLLMFKEALMPKKKRKTANPDRLNNPKYLEVQMIQMANILKDTKAVKDKGMIRTIALYNDYLKWEKKLYNKDNKDNKDSKSSKTKVVS